MTPQAPSPALLGPVLPVAALAFGLAVGSATGLLPAAERAVASMAGAQGVPTQDGGVLAQAVARLDGMARDLVVQDDVSDARRELTDVGAEQLAVLDRMDGVLAGRAGYAPPAGLEGAGPTGSDAVYPQGPAGPMDTRLFGEGRETVEMMIVQVAGEYAPQATAAGLSPTQFRALFQALVKQESAFNIHAKSHVGATGLAQLMPGTARDLGRDPNVPIENLRGGADYITQQLNRFGNVPHALAAYNAEPGRVIEYGGVPPFEETQGYVRRITAYYNEYLATIGGPDALGTIEASDFALAEYANVSDAASSYAAGSHASARQVAARLRDLVAGIDAQPDVTAAMRHNTYARAELGRILVMLTRLRAAGQVRRGAHAQHLAADRLAERQFARMTLVE